MFPAPWILQIRHRGSATVLAMLFLMVMSTLAIGMFAMSSGNQQTSANLADSMRARAAAESGLRWISHRFIRMDRPRTTIGNITPEVAANLWPEIQTAIANDLAKLSIPEQRPVEIDASSLSSSPISLGDGGRFSIIVRQHPLNENDPLDERFLRVTSRGQFGDAVHSVSMDFRIDKKVKFAIAGKVAIQLGRNTLVEGPVATTETRSNRDPLLTLSDFTHFHPGLANRVAEWQAYLKANASTYDGRISAADPVAYQNAIDAGFVDYTQDGYIDEFDLFIQQFDANGDLAVSAAEFTNPMTGQLYEPNLFAAIDSLGGPLFDGDVIRAGLNDGLIDSRDAYAKIRGQVVMASTAQAWQNKLGSSRSIDDLIVGPIVYDAAGQSALKFGATASDIFDLSPANFEQACENFRQRSGTAAGTPVKTSALIANTTLIASDANGGFVNERTPFGSTTYQATYRRPVFRNMTLRNVTIPKGLNALFENCTFEGVTFIDSERDIVTSTGTITYVPGGSTGGMGWAQRKVAGDNFSKDKVLLSSGTPGSGQTITHGSQKGNNIRFHGCTFKGPLAGSYATAYTHFANSWEFTGATLFDNQFDQTATIVSPQVNIEMGSFSNPDAAPSTLVGVVVAGNIDIRGISVVDGSIIVTGDGAGDTTLGWFGPSDSDTNPTAMPEGGFGRLNIRYNPHRALPDGIDLPIDLAPDINSYREGD